MTLSDPL